MLVRGIVNKGRPNAVISLLKPASTIWKYKQINLYSTPSIQNIKVEKTHKFRNFILFLTGGSLVLYTGGVYLSEKDPLYKDMIEKYFPWFPVYKINLEEWSQSAKNYILAKTMGFPIQRHTEVVRGNSEGDIKEEIILLDELKSESQDKEIIRLVESLNHIIGVVNKDNSSNKNKDILDLLFRQVLDNVERWNNANLSHIQETVNERTKDRLQELDQEFNRLLEQRTSEIENNYNSQFMKFKADLEEKAAKTLALGLAANENKLKAKKDNEIALMSITQVDEFNKIVTDKIEKERNGKLKNLLELDERIDNLNHTIDNMDKLITRDSIVTRLTTLVKSIQDEIKSFREFPNLNINDKIQTLKLVSSVLPLTNTKSNCTCCSSKNKSKCGKPSEKDHKVCKCSMKKSPSLLEVTLNELDDMTKNETILSNEQLYNRWSLLAREFKITSLLNPNAGLLNHLMAKIFSFFLFMKREEQPLLFFNYGDQNDNKDKDSNLLYSKVQNNIKLSNLKDAVLDAVQLDGWSRALCEDWIRDARRKLEVETLLELVDNEIKTL